ncbi:hypothetical protein [Enterovirga sp.]|jgi:hypothetical protein|uniref:hypothetical protein n=1 Tax=Enterovirga sp. TaxID=2026350 RepID=UPI0026310FED|nr:hypothetical protein [Enterovirga sp.]MDB5590486.1 hypothetical protein [Enterovirga sp.]
MAEIGMTIMLRESAEARMDEVAKSVEEAGVRIRQKLPHLGAMIGVGDASKMEALSAIQGVQQVRPEDNFQLPPLDSSIPQ